MGITFFITVGIITLLFLFGFTPPYPPLAPEGMLIDFGNAPTGSGVEQPMETKPAPPKAEAQPAKEKIQTQDLEKTVALPEKVKVEKPKPATTKTSEKPAVKTETIDQGQVLSHQKMEQMNQSKGQGNDSTPGDMGNPSGNKGPASEGAGSGDNGHVGWQLSGRGNLSLPVPDPAHNEQGDIVVRIYVDKAGNVIRAEYERSGSTITDPTLINQAVSAAKKAKFTSKTDAPDTQQGDITYHYLLH